MIKLEQQYESLPYISPAKKVVDMQREYDKLVFWMIKAMGKLNHVSLSLGEVKKYSAYDIFSLKEQLEADIPAKSYKENGQEY